MCVRVEIADKAYDEGLFFGQIQDPAIVFKPLAGLHDHGAGHALRNRNGLEVFRKHAAVEQGVVPRRPGDPFRTAGIVEMGMGVDDHRRAPCVIRC